jgi:hypothetical protein
MREGMTKYEVEPAGQSHFNNETKSICLNIGSDLFVSGAHNVATPAVTFAM